MTLASLPIEDFAHKLGAADPTPGGGSASALVGALGASLVRMVALLTASSAKFADVAPRARAIAEAAQSVERDFIRTIDDDAAAFDRVSAAYKLPKQTDSEKLERTRIIQDALRAACDPPLRVIACALRTSTLAVELADFGNANAISDAGCAALFAHAAAKGAALNVAINAKALKDRAEADSLEAQMRADLAQVGLLAEVVSSKVKSALRPGA